MISASKIQAISPAHHASDAPDQRLDANKASNRAKISCAYPKCGMPFSPRRAGQKYHTQQCRKRDWFENRFVVIGRTDSQLHPGDRVLVYATVDSQINSEGLLLLTVMDGHLSAGGACVHRGNLIKVEGE